MHYTVRPISERTAFIGKHQPSQFAVTYSQVVDLLDRELTYLKARHVVIEIDVSESDLRLDGTLRADARATSPAVRLAFESSVGALTYATDVFVRGATRVYVGSGASRTVRDSMRRDWQHNLYAIARSLEALRMVDRYGVTKRGEQYAGFKALPAGHAMPASHMTSVEAAHIIRKHADHHGGPYDMDRLIRRARAATHPDRNGGDRAAWDQVEEAAKVLGVIA